MPLNLEAPENFEPDELYSKLLGLADGLTDSEQRRAMAALVLLLVNHIGDKSVLEEALTIVRDLPPLSER